MEWTDNKELAARRQFTAFCKRVIRNASMDYIRREKRDSLQMVSIEQLQAERNDLAVMDKYETDFEHFQVDGSILKVEIRNEKLSQALSQLTDRKREIVLLSYVEGESDTEIAQRLHLDRSTVSEHRRKALAQLQKILTD